MTHRIRIAFARIALVLGSALASSSAFAQKLPITINGSATALTSTADRMISYREQNHMWQTADGGTHVVINRGGNGPSALALNSSWDGGATWQLNLVTLPQSDLTTTSDSYLDNDDLYVTYSGLANATTKLANAIYFAHLKYNPAARTWTTISLQTVYSNGTQGVLTPAVAVDAMGTRWLAYTDVDLATGIYSIRMSRQDAGSNTWVDTNFTFGATSTSGARSGRPVVTATGMGLIYAIDQTLYWAQRSNAWPATQAWKRNPTPIYKDQYADKDPYGTHYSTTTDPQSNIHLVWVDGGRLYYTRYLASTQTWDTPTPKSSNLQATYMQVVYSLGNIVIICNTESTLGVYQSSDGGANFTYTQQLQHAAPTGAISYANPREEAPGHSSSPIPVLQQYVNGATQRALFFPVPVITVRSK